jgi:AcrR family transcriptional regulator
MKTKPRRTNVERREDSRARILAAAFELLASRGYNRFSLQDVGKLAGCSHELANYFYGSKEGLLAAVAEHVVERSIPDADGLVNNSRTFDDLSELIRFYAATPRRDFQLFKAYMKIVSEAPDNPKLLQFVFGLRDRTLATFEGVIRRVQKEGGIRTDIEPADYSRLIHEYLRGHSDVFLLNQAALSDQIYHENSAFIETFIALLRRAMVPMDVSETAR